MAPKANRGSKAVDTANKSLSVDNDTKSDSKTAASTPATNSDVKSTIDLLKVKPLQSSDHDNICNTYGLKRANYKPPRLHGDEGIECAIFDIDEIRVDGKKLGWHRAVCDWDGQHNGEGMYLVGTIDTLGDMMPMPFIFNRGDEPLACWCRVCMGDRSMTLKVRLAHAIANGIMTCPQAMRQRMISIECLHVFLLSGCDYGPLTIDNPHLISSLPLRCHLVPFVTF